MIRTKVDHLFIGDDGAVYDTRNPNWAESPLRAVYYRTFGHIKTTAEYKATLRAGAYAWPGGYPMFFCTSDGAALCFTCGRKELRNVLSSIADRQNDGWRVVACDINWEDSRLYCDHCSKPIESAYGDIC